MIPRARSPQQAALETGLSLCTIYRAIHAGELRAVKRRSRWLIPVHEIRRFLGEPVETENLRPAVLNAPKLAPREQAIVRAALG